MTRKKGSFNMTANVEPRIAAPFDARLVVPARTDLTDATNFPFPYVGMIVSVQSEGKAYILIATDVTVASNWRVLGEGGGGGGSYVAGYGIDITSDVISVKDDVIATQQDLTDGLATKQDTLTAGTNITIAEDTQTGDLVISATGGGATYTAGDGLTLSGNTFSTDDATDAEVKNMLDAVFGS